MHFALRAYAPNGLRNRKTTQVEPGSLSVVTTNYYWDRGFIANETVNGVHSASNFIGVGGIFGRENFGPNGCNERFLMLKNWRGDVVSLVNDTGLLWRYDYSAFGVERPATSGCGTVWNSDGARVKPNNPFRFGHGYYDVESGLVYLRNRYYSPRVGRFITEDPYWNLANMQNCIWSIRQASNLFAFVANNPIRFVDVDGLKKGGASGKKAAAPTQAAPVPATQPTWLIRPPARPPVVAPPATPPAAPVPAAPNIVSREEWGAMYAPAEWTDNDNPHTIIVHHTVGDVPAGMDLNQFIRNQEHGHVHSEGMSTIGYNYIVAADGTIIQGRPRNAQGAHTALRNGPNHNPDTIGVAFIGTFSNGMPTQEAQDAMAWLIGDIRSGNPTIRYVRAHSQMQGFYGWGDFHGNQQILDWIGER